jgi:hypothetical protein
MGMPVNIYNEKKGSQIKRGLFKKCVMKTNCTCNVYYLLLLLFCSKKKFKEKISQNY